MSLDDEDKKRLKAVLIVIGVCLVLWLSSVLGNYLLSNKKKVITSSDSLFQISVPKEWYQTEEGALNSDANLEAACITKVDDEVTNEEYFIAIMEATTNLTKFDINDFDTYRDSVLANDKGVFGDLSAYTKTTVNNKDAYYVETEYTKNDQAIHMWIYVVQTDHYYGQVLMWTYADQKEAVSAELTSILNSLKEV